MRSIIFIFFMLVAAPAFAVCPTTLTDCPSPTFNNLTLGGTLTGGNVASSTVTPTGATTAIALADVAAQQGVLLDSFKQVGDADDTASFTRAVAAGVPILCSAKTYHVHDFDTGAVSNFVLHGVQGCVIQRNAATNPTGTFFAINATNVDIDGVTFDMNSGSVSANQWGVRLPHGGQTISVRHSIFENNNGGIGSCFIIASTGPGAGGSFNFSDNEVTNCTLQAVYIASASNGVISRNYIHDVSSFGIFIASSGAASGTNYSADILVDSNKVYRSTASGISVGSIAAPFTFGTPSAVRVVVSNNILQDHSAYGISLECDYCDAIGNYISRSSPSYSVIGAIDTLERYGKIENNTIVFSGVGFAIDIGGSEAMLVQGNVVTMDQGSAFNTGGNLHSVIRGNIANLSGTAIGIGNLAVETTGGGSPFPNVSSATVFENNVFNMSGSSTQGIAIYDNAGGSVGATANIIRGNQFNVSGGGSNPAQDIYWRGGPHSLIIDNNVHNGTRLFFQDPLGNGDLIFDWVALGGVIQGVASGTQPNIRAIMSRDQETYSAGGSVLWITPSAGGSGYTAATTIVISGTGCSGATASPQINSGVIIGVRVTASGSGCSGTVTASATDTGGGTGATFTVGTVPVMPDDALLSYLPVGTRLIQKTGSLMALQPSVPIQVAGNSGIVTLQANYGGAFWNIVNYVTTTFAVGSLPTCDATANGAYTRVTGSASSKWEARCDGTNWLWPDGTVAS